MSIPCRFFRLCTATALLLLALLSPLVPPAATQTEAINLYVPFFSQTALRGQTDEDGDPLYLGESNEVLLSEKGCAVASAAMVMATYGLDTDVEQMNDALLEANGFSGALLNWPNADAFVTAGEPWVEGVERINTGRPADYEQRVNDELEAGHPVIAFLGAAHYVVITGRDEDGGFLINDSWAEIPEAGQFIALEDNALDLEFRNITQFVFISPDENAPTNGIVVRDTFADKYYSLNGSRGGLGNPLYTAEALPGYAERWQHFEHGAIFQLFSGEVLAIYGPVWEKYEMEGGWEVLGLPRADVYNYAHFAGAAWQADFANGSIIWREGTPASQAQLYDARNAFTAEYYGNPDLAGAPAHVRFDPELNFVWATGTPGGWLDSDTFSVRWRGKMHVGMPIGWRYIFAISADDGVRLSIDGKQVLDSWDTGQGGELSRNLGSGDHELLLEYRHRQGIAYLSAAWSPWPVTVVFAAENTAGPMDRLPAAAQPMKPKMATPTRRVTSVPGAALDAALYSVAPRPVVEPGGRFSVLLQMSNTGSADWLTGQGIVLRHVAQQPLGAPATIELVSTVRSGSTYRWTLPMQAPEQEGVYRSDWQMAQDTQPFGRVVTIELLVQARQPGGISGRIDELLESLRSWLERLAEGGAESGMGTLQRTWERVQETLRSQLERLRGMGEEKVRAAIEAFRRNVEQRIQREIDETASGICRAITGPAASMLVLGLGLSWWSRRWPERE